MLPKPPTGGGDLLGPGAAPGAGPRIEARPFGATPDGTPVDLYTLASEWGLVARITNYGGIVVSLLVPDRQGRLGDVVLGHDDLSGYLSGNRSYFGALVGRYANRIAGGRFTLGGRAHALARNDGANHLHGGERGFDKRVWAAKPIRFARGVGLELRRKSPDGEEGYPGNLSVAVTYRLAGDALEIDALASADAPTVCNLSHHGYFDLDGAGASDILGHLLTLRAERFLPVGPGLIPSGELRAVGGTPMDFRAATAVGARIDAADPQLELAGGYDHCWVIDRHGGGLVPAARLVGPDSGRVMEVLTTEPGLQFYSGNFLDGTVAGKSGTFYRRRAGLCLEAQHFPDSPNQPGFPSAALEPGEAYRTTTIYRFSTAA